MPLSSLQSPISDAQAASPLSPALSQSAVAALWKGQVTEAIQLVCLEQNIGATEARDLIDTLLRSQPALRNQLDEAHADAREGLLRWLIFLLVGGVGLAHFLD
ncbi:MAG: hypothetical protein AB7F94_06700 [Nitrospira sp.]